MKQITFTPRHHQLTNTNTWTPDSQWLVFDVRPSGASFTGKTIERVNVHTGDVEVIYRAVQGAHVGVVTVHPADNHYVFIHGPENPDETWHYDFHHRRGVIATPGGVTNLDAMDITAPYTPGALRGGSHVHVFSPNGELVSFTYNDHVLHERDPALDLRNVGVAVPYGPVTVPVQHPREYSGSYWCVLVSRTTPAPRPGSDDINRAYEEGWVGNRQIAFIGDTLSLTGKKVPELFIVDLPCHENGWKQAGDTPLTGTESTMPSPPLGVVQRRLTFTHQRVYPGLTNEPRHWVRSNPQATAIAFLMRDDNGVAQLWLI
ncbi:ATP/GTP-binding protein [Salmonella enterica subsp. enterica serovar Typhimurium str. DT104]|nr:ATP/GTP-binding protein [Salmonella enterica subsp. enterica serovar Typhimurium str. DT104]